MQQKGINQNNKNFIFQKFCVYICRVGRICGTSCTIDANGPIWPAYMCLIHPLLRPICIPRANVANGAL